MGKQYLDLMQFFEGYVRNYRRMNLNRVHNRSMFTRREIDYFANLGEMLGFDSFVEDAKMDKVKGRSRPMDLAWRKYDGRENLDEYTYIALHLERENTWAKDVETIEKLFSDTDEYYIPHNVIGIMNVESEQKANELNVLVREKNAVQQSKALMVYRTYDQERGLDKVIAFCFEPDGLEVGREAICKADDLGHWFMCFEEEYEAFLDKDKTLV